MRVSTRFLSLAAPLAALCTSAPGTLAQSADSTIVVRAVNAEGQPVLDLGPADVTLRIDGRQREVKSLELVQPGDTKPGERSALPASNLPPPYAVNVASAAPKGAREFVIAIDDEGMAPGREQPVREAVKALISSLTPRDAVGLAGMKSGGLRFAPTTDHASTLEGLHRINAMGSANETAADRGCRTRALVASMAALLQDAPASRILVLFSPGVGTPSGDKIRTQLGRDADTSACELRQRDLDELGRIAAGSPASVYVVFVPEALANPTDRSDAEAGLEHIAGVTGAVMFRLVGTAEAVQRIGRTAGTYYLATVEGAIGGATRFDARVAREGVEVVARPVSTAAAAEKAGSPRDMIRTATVFRELPLRAAGFVSRQQGGGDLQVMALFEPHEPGVKLTAAVVGFFDEKGTLKAQWTAQPAELTRSPIVAAVPIAAGKYRMRVAATDAKGRAGTTDYQLDAMLMEAGPVTMSDLVLGVGQNGFVPKLQFTSEDAAAIGLLQIYGVPKDAKLDVTFELAKDEQGEAIGSGEATIAPGAAADARIAYGGFPVAAIEPGDYILRAIVNVDGTRAGVASHTLRRLK